eukprot:s3520_g10.t1
MLTARLLSGEICGQLPAEDGLSQLRSEVARQIQKPRFRVRLCAGETWVKDDASWHQLGSPLELTAVYVKCEKRVNDHATELLEAVKTNELLQVEEILCRGQHTNATDRDGVCALCFAAQQGNEEMLQLLLEAKAQADGVQRDLIQARDGSVALGDTELRFVWQAWHMATRTFVLCGRRGTYGTQLGLVTRLVGGAAASFCVAGVALGDTELRFVWEAWHMATWTFVLCGRRGTDGTQLGQVVAVRDDEELVP